MDNVMVVLSFALLGCGVLMVICIIENVIDRIDERFEEKQFQNFAKKIEEFRNEFSSSKSQQVPAPGGEADDR